MTELDSLDSLTTNVDTAAHKLTEALERLAAKAAADAPTANRGPRAEARDRAIALALAAVDAAATVTVTVAEPLRLARGLGHLITTNRSAP